MNVTQVIFDFNQKFLNKTLINGKKISIECGEKIATTCNAVAKNFPFSKVAVFYTEKVFLSNGVSITNALKRSALKPINVLIDDQKKFNINYVCGLFNLAEDVRAVIVTDLKVVDYALYFATVKDLHVFAIADDCNFFDFFKSYIEIQDDNLLDYFSCNVERTLILDEKSVETLDFSIAFAYAVSKVTALQDYRLNAVCSKIEVNKKAYSIAKEGVKDVLKAFEHGGEKRNTEIFLGSLKVAFAGLLSQGELFKFSSAKDATKLLCDGDVCAEFLCSLYMSAYYAMLNSNDGLIVNNRQKIQMLSAFTGLSINEITSRSIESLNKIQNFRDEISDVARNIVNESIKNLKYLPEILKRYFMLGGKVNFSPERIKDAISLAGNLRTEINGLSILTKK